LHCRSAGNPLEDGPEDYDVSAREWEWFDGVVKSYVGESLPMANTEAFDEPGWHKRLSPWLSPQEKWEWWRSRNLEQMRWFDPNHEGYRYPLEIICNCHWLIHDGGTWDDCGLLENQTYEREMGVSRMTRLYDDMQFTVTWLRGEPGLPPPPPEPQPVVLRVYDVNGEEKSYEWAVKKYGVLWVKESGKAWHCSQMRERTGPSSIDVYLYNEDGTPAVGIGVTFHWPDGEQTKETEVDGKAGFAYGPGSYIEDPAVGGPHWITIDGVGGAYDLVSRLGMLAGTVHDHLDLVFKYGVLEVGFRMGRGGVKLGDTYISKLWILRVYHRELFAGGCPKHFTNFGNSCTVPRNDFQIKLTSVRNDKEHTTPGDIYGSCAEMRYIQFSAQMNCKGGHVLKDDLCHFPICTFCAHRDQPGR